MKIKKVVIIFVVIITGVIITVILNNNSNSTIAEITNAYEENQSKYTITQVEDLYEKLSNDEITHEELIKYIGVQNDIVKDVNILLDEYRSGVYPLKNLTEPRSVYRETPFPEGCEIPSNIEWNDLQIIVVDPNTNQYGYAIIIQLDNQYNMYIEAGCTGYMFDSGETVYKIWLWDVKFYYSDIK